MVHLHHHKLRQCHPLTPSYKFFNTQVSLWLKVRRHHGTSTPPQAAAQRRRLPHTSPVISPLFLMKKWQVWVISLGMCPTTVEQLLRCTATAYLSCSSSSSQNVRRLTNTRTPYTLIHMMVTHTAFQYEPVTLGLGSSALFTLSLVEGP